MYVYAKCMCNALGVKEKGIGSPGIGIRVIANNHSGAWNPPLVFCKSNKPSLQS